jgi:6-methylsalicylate decarboxylase
MMAPVIDVHHHMFPAALMPALAAAGVELVGGEELPRSWTPEESLRLMDRLEIDAAILSLPMPLHALRPRKRARLARAINECGAECVRRRPARFGFLATLPLPDVDAALEEVRHALDDLGADGVVLLSNHRGIYPGDRRLDPVYEELDRRGAVVFLHPTMPPGAEAPAALELPFETTRAVASLLVSRRLDRAPYVRHIVAHCGATSLAEPDIQEIVEVMEAARRGAPDHLETLHDDATLSSDARVLCALIGLVPPGSLLLGTDLPMAQETGVHVTLGGIERLDQLAPEGRDGVRATNAARLFPRLAAAHEGRGLAA